MKTFSSADRRPPESWSYALPDVALEQLRKWDLESAEGRKMNATLAEFWTAQGPMLDDSWAICQEAMTNWKPTQDPETVDLVVSHTRAR
jgi:hypothetical protein